MVGAKRIPISQSFRSLMFYYKLRALRLKDDANDTQKQHDIALEQYRVAQRYTDVQHDIVKQMSTDPKVRAGTLNKAKLRLREAEFQDKQINQRLLRLADRAAQALTASQNAEKIMQDEIRKYDRQMNGLDKELSDTIKATNDGMRDEFLTQYDGKRKAITTRVQDTIATEQHVKAVAEPAPLAVEPSPTPALPAIAGSTLTLDTTRFRATMGTAGFNGLRQRLAGVQAIDDVATQLTNQRQALRAAITRDTQTAARALATQHGYRISVDAPAGIEITGQVRNWLQEYWPQTKTKQ